MTYKDEIHKEEISTDVESILDRKIKLNQMGLVTARIDCTKPLDTKLVYEMDYTTQPKEILEIFSRVGILKKRLLDDKTEYYFYKDISNVDSDRLESFFSCNVSTYHSEHGQITGLTV